MFSLLDIYRYFIDIGFFIIFGLMVIWAILFLLKSIHDYIDVTVRQQKGIVLIVKMYSSAILIAVFTILISYYAMNFSILFS